MNATRPVKLLLLTLVTIATALLVGSLEPRRLPWLPDGFSKPTLALEFVESPAQFTRIVEQHAIQPAGYASTLFWHSRLADLLFIAAYGSLFVALLVQTGAVDTRRFVRRLGVLLIAVAVIADYVKDYGIISGLGVTGAAGSLAPAGLIRMSALVKWGALGLGFLVIAQHLWAHRRAGLGQQLGMRLASYTIMVGYAGAGVLYLLGVITHRFSSIENGSLPLLIVLPLQAVLFWFASRRPAAREEKTYTDKLDTVRDQELEYVIRRRQEPGQPAPDRDKVAGSLVGLAMSGGGIRSATTNLGVLQALSKMGLLPIIDYLCTVSGGGYMGACLTSLLSIRQNPPAGMPGHYVPGDATQYDYHARSDLRFGTDWPAFPFNPELPPSPGMDCGPQAQDTIGKQIVAHLRTHGSFLIARRGLFKRDALRAVGHLLTGTVYHLLTTLVSLAALGFALIGLAHFLEPGLERALDPDPGIVTHQIAAVRPDGSSAGSYTVTRDDPITWTTHVSSRFGRAWHDVKDDFIKTNLWRALVFGGSASLIVFVLFVVATRWLWPRPFPASWKAGESREDRFDRFLVTTAAVLIGIAAPLICVLVRGEPDDLRCGWIAEPFLVLAGARITNFALYPLISRTEGGRFGGFELWTRQFRSLWSSFQAVTTYGLLATFLFACLPVVAYAVVHALDSGESLSSLLVPALSLLIGRLFVSGNGAPGIGRFKLPAGATHFVLGLAAFVFIAFVIVASASLAISLHWVPWHTTFAFWLAFGLSSVACLTLCLAGNINKISPHYFYRDRLLETYLRTEVPGAEKRMETLTDMMEMPLTSLHGVGSAASNDPGNQAPYLLISAAINLAGSRDLTRKDRKSGHFLFSKYYCGSRQTGYRATSAWRGGETKLGRALTISGAAASTAMGYHTFFGQSFFTAIFNLRLGYWMLNPRFTGNDELVFWPRYLLREAFAATSERTPLVNLSDGGHTGDNIGLYPLLERRCQVIIAVDAEADAALSFGSFTEALRQAYVDLGVDVDIDLSMIRPDPKTLLSQSHCAIGRIRYPECPDRPGWLIYLKNSMTGDEPAPVLNYRSRCPAFPHETTADQFFDDAQFESYRALGVHIAEGTFGRWLAELG